ncbi:HD domain-containing protein, partial [Nitrospinae bacterium AH-259-F20]|nr:HD domain-containing protein [Nitrospinae bacterium AH-259-F20]
PLPGDAPAVVEEPPPPEAKPPAEPMPSEPVAEEAEAPETAPGEVRFTELLEATEREKEPAPPGPEVAVIEEPPLPSEEEPEEEPKVLYEKIYEGTSTLYRAAAEGDGLMIAPMHPLAELLADSVTRPEEEIGDDGPLPPSLYRDIMVTPSPSLDWVAHAIQVATVALKFGAGLGYSHDELTKLALAGLLHDVGMMTIDPSVLDNPGSLSSDQRSAVQKHPERGAELLAEAGAEFEWLQKVALQEHERFQGQGYPHHISGKEIDEYAQIIGLVDTFVAMTQPRPWRPAITPHEAAKEIVYIHKGEFNPRFIKLFLQNVTIFPINSLVKLNNNVIGRVIAVHKDMPLRPTIEILYAPHEKHMAEHSVLDLRNHPLLHIIEPVTDEELGNRLK